MKKTNASDLPQVAVEYIDSVIKHMKYRKKVRAEVRQELTDHFTDALAGCETDEEKQQVAEELIVEFGDVKLLGKLMRRAKKRCRPLWQKVMVMMLEIIGVIILLLVLRVGYLAIGRPTISVDYLKWMDEKVCAGRDESLNAYHDYQKAFQLIPEEFPPEIEKIFAYTDEQQKTPEDWQAIEAFLKTQSEAIKAFRIGAAKPYYWNIYSPPEGVKASAKDDPLEYHWPELTGIHQLFRLIRFYQIPFDLHSGNKQQAIDDTLIFCEFARHLMGKGLVLEGLIGVAMESCAWESVYELLDQVDISAEDLFRFQQVVEKNYDPNTSLIGLEIERAYSYDYVQRMFTDDGQGDGRLLLKGTDLVASNWIDVAKGIAVGFPRRKEAVAMIDKLYAEAEKLSRFTPWMLHTNERDSESFENTLSHSGYLLQMSFDSLSKALPIGWQVRASQAGLIGTLVILRFEKENERLPESWDELLEKRYLKIIPMDPYSDAPLVYKKTEEGFILYSVGLNLTDDGGVTGTDTNGKPRQWAENGDVIFWPVDTEGDR